MSWGSLRYLAKQGISNIWINRLMTFASVGILSACLVLIGGATLISLNVRAMFHTVESQNEMRVFVEDAATDDDMVQLRGFIAAMPEVETYKFISREEAIKEALVMMGLDPEADFYIFEDYYQSGSENPFPANYVITLKEISATEQIKDELERHSAVYSVRVSTEVVTALSGIEKVLLIFGGMIIVALLMTSLVVISNSIRLTVFSRRREINIMKYVGATNGFIRLPFVVEGTFIGILSAALSFVVIYGLYEGVNRVFSESATGFMSLLVDSMLPFSSLWVYVISGFAAMGIIIGAIGSSSAIRKYLKV